MSRATSRLTRRDGRTLVVNTEVIEISYMSEPDPNWKLTDADGHGHYRNSEPGGEAYPTLELIVDLVCHQEHSVYGGIDVEGHPAKAHYECRLCGETITPGTLGPGVKRIPGLTEYLIDGVPVTKEAADEFVAEVSREQHGGAGGG